jgi:hypothetical protein
MLTVAIDMDPPAEAAPLSVSTVVESCARALGGDRCKSAATLEAFSIVTWHVTIRAAEPEPSTLIVEFRDRSSSGVLLETRTLSFSESDSPESRLSSVGAIIAAFVAARDAPGTAKAPPQAPPAPAPPPASPAPLPPRPRAQLGLDLAALAGPGLDRGAPRLGVLGRGYIGLLSSPSVLGVVSARYAERPSDLALTWSSLSAGGGVRITNAAFSAELIGEFVFERFGMALTDVVADGQGDAARNRFGGRLNSNLARRISPLFWLVGGLEVSALRPALTIIVDEEDRGRLQAVGWAGSFGLRFAP